MQISEEENYEDGQTMVSPRLCAGLCPRPDPACGREEKTRKPRKPLGITQPTESGGVAEDARDTLDKAGDTVRNEAETAGDTAKDAADDVIDGGKNVVHDAADAVRDAVDGVGNAAKDIVDGADNAANGRTAAKREK